MLDAFLDEIRDRPYKAGECDCWLFVADWVRVCTGRDPIPDLRGRYHSRSDVMAMVRARGGFKSLVMSTGAVEEISKDEMAPGDIAEARLGLLSVGAICIDDRHLATKTEMNGLLIWPGPVVAAYRII